MEKEEIADGMGINKISWEVETRRDATALKGN